MTFEKDQSLVHLLRRASQIADDHFAKEAPALTARQFVVLQAISENPDGSQTDLVRATAVDRSTMADIIRRLQKKGLLVRRRRRDDARAYSVRLSARGEELMDRGRSAAARANDALRGRLRDGELAKLVSSLKALLSNVEADRVANADASRAQSGA